VPALAGFPCGWYFYLSNRGYIIILNDDWLESKLEERYQEQQERRTLLHEVGRSQECENLNKVHIEAQGHVFKVRVSGQVDQSGGGKRGRVRGMSRKSRKRMLETMARLEPQPVPGFRGVGLFITLTYGGNEWELPQPDRVKRDLDVFLKRVRRTFPDAAGVWRFEVESSGKRQYHPHIHVLLFNVGYIHHAWVRANWNEVTGQAGNNPSEQVTTIKSWRGVLAYVAKYMTKPEFYDGEELPGSPLGAEASLAVDLSLKVYPPGNPWLVYMTYLTGRVWGVFNRDGLPWGDLIDFSLSARGWAWFYDLKRAARHKWGGVNGNRGRGFMLFCNNPDDWVDLATFFHLSDA
jgi:hypothetical protein